jgi:hypothetical protein
LLTPTAENFYSLASELAYWYLEFPQGDGFANVEIYKASTSFLAHDVLRKNVSDDFIDGLLLKQFMAILWASPSQP